MNDVLQHLHVKQQVVPGVYAEKEKKKEKIRKKIRKKEMSEILQCKNSGRIPIHRQKKKEEEVSHKMIT